MRSIRSHTLTLLGLLLLSSALPAQDKDEGVAQAGRPEGLPPSVQAIVYRDKEGRVEQLRGIYIFKVEAGRYVYADNPRGANPRNIEPATIKNMALKNPEDIVNALDAYQREEYAAALPLLAAVIKDYKPLRELDGVPIKRAEIFHMDCLRRLKKWEELRDLMSITKPEGYSSWGQDMLKAFAAWDGYPKKDWGRIEVLTRTIDEIPAGEAATQVAFLRAEALRNLGGKDKTREALAEYHRAMIMDYTRSREIMGDAALAALEVYRKDALVKDFFERYGGPDYNPEAAYVLRVKEAGWVAQLIHTQRPGGRSLPTNMNKFLEAYRNLKKDEKNGGGGIPGAPDLDEVAPPEVQEVPEVEVPPVQGE